MQDGFAEFMINISYCQPRRNHYSSKGVTVGSQAQGSYELISSAFMSSTSSSKSYTFAFSMIREGVTLETSLFTNEA